MTFQQNVFARDIFWVERERYDDGDEDDNKTNMQNEYTTDKTRSCKHIRITKGSLTPIKRIIRTSYELMNLQQRCAKCIDFFAPLYYFLFVVSQIFEYLNIPLIEISDLLEVNKNNIHCKVFSQIYIWD